MIVRWTGAAARVALLGGVFGLVGACEEDDRSNVPVAPASSSYRQFSANSNNGGGGGGDDDDPCKGGLDSYAGECCAKSCGSCDQDGCESRGNADLCCPKTIERGTRDCDNRTPPCHYW